MGQLRDELSKNLEKAEQKAIKLLVVLHQARLELNGIRDLDNDGEKGEYDELDRLLTDGVRSNILGLHENVEAFLRLFWEDDDPWNSSGGE